MRIEEISNTKKKEKEKKNQERKRKPTDDADGCAGVCGDVAHARHNHLKDWTTVLAQEVDLIQNYQLSLPHVRARVPLRREGEREGDDLIRKECANLHICL